MKFNLLWEVNNLSQYSLKYDEVMVQKVLSINFNSMSDDPLPKIN